MSEVKESLSPWDCLRISRQALMKDISDFLRESPERTLKPAEIFDFDPTNYYLRRLEVAVKAARNDEEEKKKADQLLNELRRSVATQTSYTIGDLIMKSEEYQGLSESLKRKGKDREVKDLERLGVMAQLANQTHKLLEMQPQDFFAEYERSLANSGLPEKLIQQIKKEAGRLARWLYPEWQPPARLRGLKSKKHPLTY
jgi:hypothetical protein